MAFIRWFTVGYKLISDLIWSFKWIISAWLIDKIGILNESAMSWAVSNVLDLPIVIIAKRWSDFNSSSHT